MATSPCISRGGPFNTGMADLTTNASGTDIVVGTSVSFPTLDYGNTSDETGIVATSETVSAGVMTLFNSGATAVGTIAVGTSLSTADFMLVPVGTTSTDVILNTVFGTYSSTVTLLTNPTTIAGTGNVTGSLASTTGVFGPSGTTWNLTNAGLVHETGANSDGISFASAGTITNTSGGTIIGGATGTSAAGIVLAAGGTVINGSSGDTGGLIEGAGFGVDSGSDGIVTNFGTIDATAAASGSYGVSLLSVLTTGIVNNLGSASLVEGYGGVKVGLNGTVTNAGTIASTQGTSGVAVHFTDGNSRLIDDPGAVFIGSIYGGSGGTAVLELASAASVGTIAGFGTGVINFTALVFDSGAQWTVAGNDTASGLGTLAISGFTIGDTIDLTGFVAVSRTFASDTLVLTDGDSTHETLNIQGAYTTSNFHIGSDGDGGTDIAFQSPPTIAAGGTVSFAGDGPPVVLDNTLSITDPNSGRLVSGTISIGTGFITGDVLNFTSLDGITGSFDPSDGTLTLSGTASVADYQGALDSISYDFTPGSGDPTAGGTDDSRTISWTVADAVSSSDPVTSTLDVTHNPPVIDGTVAGQAATDEATLDPFSGVTVTDPNISQTETVTIVLSDRANGTLSNLDGGTFNNGTYVVTGTTLAVTTAIDGLVFTPTAHQVSPGDTVTTTFTITTTDSYGDSVTDSTTTVIATAVNDPPVITQTTSNLGVPSDNASTLFAGLTVTDPDAGHIDTLTVTMSNPAGGAFSNLSGGSYDASTGSYTFIGSALQVSAALQALVFMPAAPASGFVASTTDFSVVVTGPGGTAANDAISATAVSQVFGLGSVPFGDDAISVSPDGSSFPAPVDGENNEAVVTDRVSGATYVLPSGYQAEFLGGTAGAALSDPAAGNALLIGNNGNDTLTAAAGSDTLAAGTSDNLLSVSGANDAIDVGSGMSTVDAAGSNDTVFAGSGATSVFAAGSHADVLGSPGGLLSVLDTGTNDTIGAFGALPAVVSLGGSSGLAFGGSNAFTASVGGTSNTLIGGSGSTSATLSGSAGNVFGGSGSLSVYDSGFSDTIAAFGASSANVSLAGSDALLFGGSNSISVTASNSSQTIVGGSGAASISITNIGSTTNDEVLGGSGSLTVDDEGQGDTIASFASSSANVTLGGQSTGDLLFGGTTALNATVAGTNDTVVGGSGPSTIDASNGVVVFGGSGPLSFVGGASASTIVGAAGGLEMVTVGSGGVLFFAGTNDNPTIVGGGGATTVVGSTGSGVVFSTLSGSGGLDFLAGSGNESLDAANSPTSNTLGFFDAAMSLGGGAHDTVTGWSAQDSLFLMGYDSTTTTTVDGGGDFTVDLTHGATITFTDTNSAAFMGRMLYVPTPSD